MSEPIQSVFELPAAQPSTPRPAADSPGRALAAAARNLLPVLEAGHRLVAPIVTTAVHDAWQAVDTDSASLELQVLLRRRGGRHRPVPAQLGRLDAEDRHRCRGPPPDDPAHREPRAHPHPPQRAPGRVRPVLDAARARLRRTRRRSGRALRHRPRAVRRHRRPRGAARHRPRPPLAAAPERTVRRPPRAARRDLRRRQRHPAQRRTDPRPPAARAPQRRPHEPALRRPAHDRQAPPPRRPGPHQVGLRGTRSLRPPRRHRRRQLHPRLHRLARHPRQRRRGAPHPVRQPCPALRLPAPRHRRRNALPGPRTRPPERPPSAIRTSTRSRSSTTSRNWCAWSPRCRRACPSIRAPAASTSRKSTGIPRRCAAATPPGRSGLPSPSGSPAPSSTRRPWSSPPRWPTSPRPSPSTAPSCRRSSPSTACCPTRSSKASPWRDRPTNACCPPTTASTPTTSARSPSTNAATRWTPP